MRSSRFVVVALLALPAVAMGCSGMVHPGQPARVGAPVAAPVASSSVASAVASPETPTSAAETPAPLPRTPAPSQNGPSRSVPLQDDLAFFGSGLSFTKRGSFGLERATVLPATGSAPGPSLRVIYPAGSASNRSAADYGTAFGGTQVYLRLVNGAVDRARLHYYVRFQPGFNFVKGGKLPGLYGGTMTSGGNIPDGSNGFSTRYMWRAGGAGEVYAYLPSSITHGTSLGRGSWNFAPGQWTQIEQEVRLNTPGRPDGSITVWLNGSQVFQQTGMVYRTTGDLKIEGLFFSTFFGGGDSSWASPTDQYAEFADFSLR